MTTHESPKPATMDEPPTWLAFTPKDVRDEVNKFRTLVTAYSEQTPALTGDISKVVAEEFEIFDSIARINLLGKKHGILAVQEYAQDLAASFMKVRRTAEFRDDYLLSFVRGDRGARPRIENVRKLQELSVQRVQKRLGSELRSQLRRILEECRKFDPSAKMIVDAVNEVIHSEVNNKVEPE